MVEPFEVASAFAVEGVIFFPSNDSVIFFFVAPAGGVMASSGPTSTSSAVGMVAIVTITSNADAAASVAQ